MAADESLLTNTKCPIGSPKCPFARLRNLHGGADSLAGYASRLVTSDESLLGSASSLVG